MVQSERKLSQLESQLYKYIVGIFAFLLFLSSLCGILYVIWVSNNQQDHPYLNLDKENLFRLFIIKALNWVQLYSNLIPISLIVTVETVKFF